jgi:hypothetical protein
MPAYPKLDLMLSDHNEEYLRNLSSDFVLLVETKVHSQWPVITYLTQGAIIDTNVALEQCLQGILGWGGLQFNNHLGPN